MARGNKKAAANGTGSSTPKAEEAVQVSKEAVVETQASTSAPSEKPSPNGQASSPYTREVEKRLAKWSKKKRGIEAIEAKIAGLTPQEQEITKLINNDERKKLAEKATVDERVKEYQDLASGLQAVAAAEEKTKASEKEAAETEAAANLAAKVEEARKAGYEEGVKAQKDVLLTCFRFLRLAGYRRAVPDENVAENEAIEKVLVMVYSSEDSATAAIEKLAASKDEPVEGSEGVTYARIKEIANNLYATDEETVEPAEESASVQTSHDLGESTVLITGEDAETTPTETVPPPQALTEAVETTPAAPAATVVDDGAANAAAVSQTGESAEEWDNIKAGGESSNNGATAEEAPAATSWADQSHEESTAEPAAAQPAEARFQQVGRGRGRGRGGPRPDGQGRGGYRGRGEGYRGRGEFRGDRGNFRGRGRPFRPRGDRGGYGQAPVPAPAPAPAPSA